MTGSELKTWRMLRGWSPEMAALQLGLDVDKIKNLEEQPILTDKDARLISLLMKGLGEVSRNFLLDLSRESRHVWMVEWRHRMKLSQAEAANVLGLKSPQTVSNYERGKYQVTDQTILLAYNFEERVKSLDEKINSL